VIYLAALANIDDSLYDAAAMDGAGAVRRFLHVTLPGVRSTMLLIGLLSSIAAFRVFGEVYVLTNGTGGVGGRNLTMTMLIQREGTGLQAQTGYAGAISLVMFVLLGGLIAVQLWLQRKQADR
jgi:multiple sugar transport system permease protein